MGKSVLMRRSVLLVLVGIVLASLLTAAFYMVSTRSFFASMKADELLPRASTISQWVTLYQQGQMSLRGFQQVLGSNSTTWDAQVIIYHRDGSLFVWTESPDTRNTPFSQEALLQDPSPLAQQVEMVLSGQSIRSLPAGGSSAQGAGQNLIIGVPVVIPGSPSRPASVTGAVLMVKPMREIDLAISAINQRLTLIMLSVFAMMLLPTIIASRRLIRPLNHMRDTALAMAEGNFSATADEMQKGEVGQLGWALNHLSRTLSGTILALELERNRLGNILYGLRDGIIAVDSTGHITHLNPALLRLFGHPVDFMPTCQRVLFDDPELWADFEQVASQGKAVEREITRGDRILRVVITPLRDEDGLSAGAVGMFQDTTEAVRLEQTRRDYVANVSHELKTPLASMRGLVETLQDGLIHNEGDRQRYYGYILRECMRLTRLINDLLELSRLQSGQLAVERRVFDMNALLQEVAWHFTPRAEDVGLDFALNLPANCPPAMSNPDRVEQVLVILLDNAIKYTQEGSVQLSAAWDPSHILLSVRDTGPGIQPEDLEHIFERFYKADRAHSENGTGLGLSIAHELLEQLGETITVDSRPGEGTTFTFTVRRADTGNVE